MLTSMPLRRRESVFFNSGCETRIPSSRRALKLGSPYFPYPPLLLAALILHFFRVVLRSSDLSDCLEAMQVVVGFACPLASAHVQPEGRFIELCPVPNRLMRLDSVISRPCITSLYIISTFYGSRDVLASDREHDMPCALCRFRNMQPAWLEALSIRAFQLVKS